MPAVLPVMVASGLLAVLVTMDSGPPGSRDASDAWLFNMGLAHGGAVDAAARRGFTAGPVQPGGPWPFRDIGGWRGEVVVDGKRTVVLTWSTSGSVPLRAGRRLARDLPPPVPTSHVGGGGGPIHFSGGFGGASGAGTIVGNSEIPAPNSEIPDGTPVLGTWVRI